MQDDLVWETSDPKQDSNNTVLEESPKKYLVSPEKSNKSLSTFDSEVTDNSKRSTEEEELRSLSTTPRYSHEDLGRIVSPPHSSDFTSTATEGEDFDETLSAQQMLLRSQTTQYTHPKPLVITEEDISNPQYLDLRTVTESDFRSSHYYEAPDSYPSQLSAARRSEAPATHRSEAPATHRSAAPVTYRSEARTSHQSEALVTYRSEAPASYRSNLSEVSDHSSEQGWVKPIKQPYHKVYTIPEKGSAKTTHSTIQERDWSDRATLKSNITAPEFASLKARKEFQRKPNYTDQDLNKPLKPLSEASIQRHLKTVAPHYARTQLKDESGHPHLSLRGPAGVPNYGHLRAEELLEMRMRNIDNDLHDILMDAEKVQRNLANEQDHRRLLQNHLQEVDEERQDLSSKLAALRVKLGVANSNYNVSKNECDQMRKKFQETQIQKARLEERIQACSKELEKLKDPNNPESNVNMKKVVLNDRKEIRRLRTDLEGVRSERSEIQKQIQDRDEKIKMLHIYIGEAKDQFSECQKDLEVAKISVVGERKKREEVEARYNELLKDKHDFDAKMAEIQGQLDIAVNGTTGIYQISETYREKEQTLLTKIESVEKKLRDVLAQIEQQKNRNMPVRTASSIKYHQYRMFRGSLVTDTTPHVLVVTDPNASLASSGFMGKTVVSTKPVKSLPAKGDNKITPRGRAGSLPAKK